jgi:hypothetical protein
MLFYFNKGVPSRVGTKTLFSLFGKTKTLTKSVTVFAKFRLIFAKCFRKNPNLTKNGKNTLYRYGYIEDYRSFKRQKSVTVSKYN